MMPLTSIEKQNYLEQVLLPVFMPTIEQEIFSCIFNENHEIVICTNQSARSLGLNNWQQAIGISYTNTPALLRKICGEKYSEENEKEILKYTKVILKIQQSIFEKKRVASFFDLLPYNGTFKSYLVTYMPLFHTNGEVIAIQSVAHESKFFGFQEHFFQLASEPLSKKYLSTKNLSRRELEIMFLLANGLSQEQIAKTLQVSRSTIATIIANQLSEKFNIPGANTQLLSKIAIEDGYFQYIPESLYRPFVVSLVA